MAKVFGEMAVDISVNPGLRIRRVDNNPAFLRLRTGLDPCEEKGEKNGTFH
jgi:hypothetical protein